MSQYAVPDIIGIRRIKRVSVNQQGDFIGRVSGYKPGEVSAGGEGSDDCVVGVIDNVLVSQPGGLFPGAGGASGRGWEGARSEGDDRSGAPAMESFISHHFRNLWSINPCRSLKNRSKLILQRRLSVSILQFVAISAYAARSGSM